MSTQDTSVLHATANYYNNVPYHSNPFPQSHPGLLKGVASLFGIVPKDLNKARVLELGCASGGNLIPLAYFYPEIDLVGVDLSEVQIQEGQALVKELGLDNRVALHQMSITDIPESFGKFDYIVCHGVYSWVPEFVQEGILDIVSKHLVDDGVAYISYNIYPGWKTLEIARDSMLFHTRHITDPAQKIQHARVMINFMQEHAKKDSIYKQIMDNAQRLIHNSADYYVSHEFLEIHNSPCYFLEMVEKAEKHGLAYLSDCSISSVFSENWGDEVRNELLKASGHNQVVLEQYIDYMTNRQFRQSIFMKSAESKKLSRSVNLEKIKKLNYSLHVEKETTPRENDPEFSYFCFNRSPNSFYRTQDTALIPYLESLIKLNHKIFKFEEYAQVLEQQLGHKYQEEVALSLLQRLVILGLITPFGDAPQTNAPTTELSEKPKISEFNRLAAKTRNYLVNSNLEMISVDEVAMHIIPAMDGSHDKQALVEILLAAATEDKVFFHRTEPGKEEAVIIKDEEELKTLSANYINDLCNRLQRYSMFVA